jgi:hypothetical protein
MAKDEFKNIDDLIDFIFSKWDQAGLEISEKLKVSAKKTTNTFKTFNDNVMDCINNAIETHTPSCETPDWLNEIDEYFTPTKPSMFNKMFSKKSKLFETHHYFVAIIDLIIPFVYLDQIVKMNTFTDLFIMELELAFMTRLNVPRDATEAERLYKIILQLPKESTYFYFGKPKRWNQPYMAQMMFVVLLMRKVEKGSDLWNFQYQALQTCPKYLLDYPQHSIENNERPAFWMAYLVTDPDFRQILKAHNNVPINNYLKDVMEYEAGELKAKQALSSDKPKIDKSLLERVPETQQELAQLLIDFESLLKQDFEDIYANLNPPVNDDQIEKLNDVLAPLKIPEELATLYKWHNGIEYGTFLFEYPEFFSIEHALHQYKETVDMGQELGWSKAWFVMGYGNQVYWIIPLAEKKQEIATVIYHDIVDGDLKIYHSSTMDMIRTYIDLYKQGGAPIDSNDSYREIDKRLYNKLRLRHSPNAYSGPQDKHAVFSTHKHSNWPEDWKKHRIIE